MARSLSYGLLGPLEVRDGSTLVPIRPGKVRVLLASLLLSANRPVPHEVLAEWLWGDKLPYDPRATLATYVMRLRHALGAGEPTIHTGPTGYLIRATPEQLDVLRFTELVTAARRADTPEDELRLLTEALAQWRGPALTDVGSEALRRGFAVELEERRLQTIERRTDVALALGRHTELVAGLTSHVVEHPLRERFWTQLMLALYRSGRQAEALDAYSRLRTLLIDELGLEPTEEVRRLHQQILAADPALDPPSDHPIEQVPRQLPAPPQAFTGRATELAHLDQVHDAAAVVITAIDGMAGIGKTALAVRAAHQLVGHYPDGQLFLDLHGYTEGMAPVKPGDALERMLRAAGVPGQQIPADVDERAALYRSRLADRKILIVLDNALDEAQVGPLLPGTPGCLVLVTSRRRLTGLDHTHTLSLDVLPLADATALLVRSAGEHRLDGTTPDVLEETVELCGRLPLAIRVAAARLRSRPTWTATHLVERLRDQQNRLAELEAGQRSVAAALDVSYRDLRPQLQRAHRLLGLHPGGDFDSYAAAALIDATPDGAEKLIEQLLDAHLLQEPTPDRFRFHDLVRDHAVATSGREETEVGRRAAVTRLLDFYRYTASVAMDAAHPHSRDRRPDVPPAHTPTPSLPAPAKARAWLDTELPNLVAMAQHAAEQGWPDHALHLSATLHMHLRIRRHYADAETLHRHALGAAQASGNRIGEVDALTDLGRLHRLQGRMEQARDSYKRALNIARTVNHRAGEGAALAGLGDIHVFQGAFEHAAEHYARAREIARLTADHGGELEALLGLGWVNQQQGLPAVDVFEQGLAMARTAGDRAGEQVALLGLGQGHRRQGRLEQAIGCFEEALHISHDAGIGGDLGALTGLAATLRQQGHYERSVDTYRQVLDLAQEIGNPNWEYEAVQGLGRLECASGRPEKALACHKQALDLATDLGQQADQARAHDGLAHAHRSLNQREQAREHWQRALDILTSLGLDVTEDDEATTANIRAHLRNLTQPSNDP